MPPFFFFFSVVFIDKKSTFPDFRRINNTLIIMNLFPFHNHLESTFVVNRLWHHSFFRYFCTIGYFHCHPITKNIFQ